MLLDVLARGNATVKEAFRAAYAGEELTEKQMNIVVKCTEGGERGGATVKEAFRTTSAREELTEKQMNIVVKITEGRSTSRDNKKGIFDPNNKESVHAGSIKCGETSMDKNRGIFDPANKDKVIEGIRDGLAIMQALHAEKDDQGKAVHAKRRTTKHYKEEAEKLLLSGKQCYKFTCVNCPDVVKAAERGDWANKARDQRKQRCTKCGQHNVPKDLVFGESGRAKTRGGLWRK